MFCLFISLQMHPLYFSVAFLSICQTAAYTVDITSAAKSTRQVRYTAHLN